MTPSGRESKKTTSAGAVHGPTDGSLLARVLGALDEIHSQYEELEVVSRSQDELVERDEGDELLDLLARRQELVDRLCVLDRAFAPLRQDWDRAVPAAGEADRARVQSRLDAIQDLASWVAHRDGAATQRLQRRRDALAEELAGLSRSNTARRAYQAPAHDQPRFQDREG